MTDAFGLLGLLWLLFNNRGAASSSPSPSGGGAAPRLPAAPAGAPAWPQALPTGLPEFPGSSWEYDEPPPKPVVQRAQQLVSALWKEGKGAHRTEQTAGRWITYRAEIVRGGKQGVVAYRIKGSGTLKQPTPRVAPEEQYATPGGPAPGAPWTVQHILTATSAGWPQPMAGKRSVATIAGRWYAINARFDIQAPANPGPHIAEGLAKGIALGGGVNVQVSAEHPYAVSFQLQAQHSVTIPIGVQIRMGVGSVIGAITFINVKEIEAPKGPKVEVEVGPAVIDPTPTDPLVMRDLKRGDVGEDVKLVQRRLLVEPVDGKFGPITQTKVIEFQRSKGLAPNLPTETLRARGFGAVKRATWTALFGGTRV